MTGFGPSSAGEDQFDAFLGLLGMIVPPEPIKGPLYQRSTPASFAGLVS
jgi:hypothetical protein